MFIIDARLGLAGAAFAVASAASLCGLIHSPLAERRALLAVGRLRRSVSAHLAGAYGGGGLCCCLAALRTGTTPGGVSGPIRGFRRTANATKIRHGVRNLVRRRGPLAQGDVT